jgi:hypothetical protein
MQGAIPGQLTNTLATHPDLICQLMPLEQQAKRYWLYAPGKHSRIGVRGARGHLQSQSVGMPVQRPDPESMASLTAGERSWLFLRFMQETSLGDFIRDLVIGVMIKVLYGASE